MAVKYDSLISKIKKYIEDSFHVKVPKYFDIDWFAHEKEYRKTEEEKEVEQISIDWLNNIDIEKPSDLPNNQKVFIARKQNSGLYIIYMGERNYTVEGYLSQIIKECECDLGVFIKLFEKEETYPLINYELSRDEIIEIIELGDDYTYCFEYNNIKKLFKNIKIFRLAEEYQGKVEEYQGKVEDKISEDIVQLQYRVLSLLDVYYRNKDISTGVFYTKELLEIYTEVLSQELEYIPYDTLYMSLNQSTTKYIFIELYRMIEKLYPVSYCKALKDEFNLQGSLEDINKALDEKLGWRHRERDAICELFKLVQNKQYIKDMKAIMGESSEQSNVAEWIYAMRNQIVHMGFLLRENKVKLDEVFKDDKFIRILIKVIIDLYREFQEA